MEATVLSFVNTRKIHQFVNMYFSVDYNPINTSHSFYMHRFLMNETFETI